MSNYRRAFTFAKQLKVLYTNTQAVLNNISEWSTRPSITSTHITSVSECSCVDDSK